MRASESRIGTAPADRLIRMISDAGLGPFETEHPFARTIGKGWRFDVAWPSSRVAVEIEGGIFGRGGKSEPCALCGQARRGAHGSIGGILRDIEKYNAGVLLGWRIYRVPTNRIDQGTIDAIRRLLIGAHRGRIVSVPRRS